MINSQETLSLKFAMELPWYKEYGTFLMIPALSTLACCFIPFFHCEQGLSYMAIIPLIGTFSYGNILAPRKAAYEKSWQKFMDYPTFVLASVKKTLSFAIPTGVASWITSLVLSGYPKELAMFFEAAVWGLSSGLCLYAFITYTEEAYKLRKANKEEFKAKMINLWKWIIPPIIVFALLLVSKIYIFWDLTRGRS